VAYCGEQPGLTKEYKYRRVGRSGVILLLLLTTDNMSFFTADTVLTSPRDINLANIVYDIPTERPIPNSNMTYRQVKMGVRLADGRVAPLILGTERVYSYGVAESTSPDNAKVNGYQMGLCLWSRSGCTPEEKLFSDTVEAIVNHAKEHILSIKDKLKKHDLDASDLKKLSPLYWKRDPTGKVMEEYGPTLYVKLQYSRANNEVETAMFDSHNNPLNPLSIMDQPCYVSGAIKFESIYIGTKIKLQIKMYEAVVDLLNTRRVRLLGGGSGGNVPVPVPVAAPTSAGSGSAGSGSASASAASASASAAGSAAVPVPGVFGGGAGAGAPGAGEDEEYTEEEVTEEDE
jgi:hypothetical protein